MFKIFLTLFLLLHTFIFSLPLELFSNTTTFIYDELDRLIEKRYDNAGRIETTPPTTTAIPSGGLYLAGQTVSLTCNDGQGTGCARTYYTTNGTTPTTSSPVYSSPLIFSSTTALKFFSRDFAGNNETVQTQVYTIDGTAPTGTISINGGAASTTNPDVTLSLSCTDNIACSEMKFSNDNVTYSSPEAVGTSKAWTLLEGSGNRTVYVKYKDTAGNWSNAYSDDILLTAPLISVGGTTYSSLQEAYNAAASGSTIKCQAVLFVENLMINRDINVTLDGGYDATFTSNAGGQTTLKGKLQTYGTGGTLTITNFMISN